MDTISTRPTVHLNGTGQTELSRMYADAYTSVRQAVDDVAASGPNGRDYYVQGPDAFGKAQAEHVSRLRRLEAVRDELLALFDAVEAQS